MYSLAGRTMMVSCGSALRVSGVVWCLVIAGGRLLPTGRGGAV
jgi:hypothetical protein